jgi:predicted 5'-methylthioadenosine/S-adenosylhomocysteine nucleosidase
VLVVAATVAELDFVEGAETLCCGVGPVEAAAATARALERARPSALLQIGIAGARSLPPPTLVLGTESVYCDLESSTLALPKRARVRPDGPLLAAARRALPGVHESVIATSARVGGGGAYEVEAMEGFGVLRAAEAAGVPALELRAVSNAYSDARDAWRIEEALAALAAAVSVLIGTLDA